MVNQRNILTAFLVVVSALIFSAVPAFAAKSPVKILGMNVESEELSAKDKRDLFKVIQATLKGYPTLSLQNPPDTELTDIMMDLECIDMDAECLAKVGKKYGAKQVFYTQVDKDDGKYSLIIRVVDVSKGKARHDKTTKVKTVGALSNALQANVVKVFGKAPSKEPKPGTLMVRSAVPGAKIFVNGLYVGIGRIKIRRPPGKYTVKVTSAGYKEVIFNVQLKSGKTVKKKARLKYAAVVKPKKDDKKLPEVAVVPLYEKWWFWTAIGGAALLTTIVAVASSGGDKKGVGPVIYSVDPQNAWRDGTTRQGASR
jgi:hypothetical protein